MLPKWIFPQKLIKVGMLAKFFIEEMQYGKELAFEKVPKATKFYLGHSLTISSEARGLGLGKELLKRSMDMARNLHCSHMYVLATSCYSQAIFKKLNFDILTQVEYEKFMDSNGTPFFQDMREHVFCEIVVFDLENM